MQQASQSKQLFYGTSTERANLARQPESLNPGDVFTEVGSSVFEWDGTSWIQISTNGGAHVLQAGSVGTLAPTTVAVAGLTTIGAAIDTRNANFLTVKIDNSDDTGSAAILFDAFEIQISSDGGTTFDTLVSASAEYTAPVAPLVAVEKDLTVLAANATGFFVLDVRGIDRVRCQASADTTQSVGVTGTWSAN